MQGACGRSRPSAADCAARAGARLPRPFSCLPPTHQLTLPACRACHSCSQVDYNQHTHAHYAVCDTQDLLEFPSFELSWDHHALASAIRARLFAAPKRAHPPSAPRHKTESPHDSPSCRRRFDAVRASGGDRPAGCSGRSSPAVPLFLSRLGSRRSRLGLCSCRDRTDSMPVPHGAWRRRLACCPANGLVSFPLSPVIPPRQWFLWAPSFDTQIRALRYFSRLR